MNKRRRFKAKERRLIGAWYRRFQSNDDAQVGIALAWFRRHGRAISMRRSVRIHQRYS